MPIDVYRFKIHLNSDIINHIMNNHLKFVCKAVCH